jgi:hypothetical protein
MRRFNREKRSHSNSVWGGFFCLDMAWLLTLSALGEMIDEFPAVVIALGDVAGMT